MIKHIFFIFFSSFLMLFTNRLQAQERVISINELFELTEKNSQQLKVASSGIDVAKQAVEVAKMQQLPSVSTAVSAGYLGNAQIIESDFSKRTNIPMPHFSNSFGLQASQLVFKGNAIRNSIAAASLQEQLAVLNLERNTQDMKLLVLSNYFDLYRLYNQQKVYDQNISLAQQRLKNIQKMYNQGMVTRNDIIRSELQLSNLNMALQVVKNNIAISNNRLTTAIGLPEATIIRPDTASLNSEGIPNTELFYQREALSHYPAIKMAEKNTEIARKSLDIVRAEKAPAISLYGGRNIARPVTTATPLDKYSAGWQIGVSLSFDISSLYKADKRIKQSALQVEQLKAAEEVQRQNTAVSVNTAFIKLNEAIAQQKTIERNKLLAEENYRIMEKKYLNQMALLVDMLDAANAKLDADLQTTNAEINKVYTYYMLLNTTGKL